MNTISKPGIEESFNLTQIAYQKTIVNIVFNGEILNLFPLGEERRQDASLPLLPLTTALEVLPETIIVDTNMRTRREGAKTVI